MFSLIRRKISVFETDVIVVCACFQLEPVYNFVRPSRLLFQRGQRIESINAVMVTHFLEIFFVAAVLRRQLFEDYLFYLKCLKPQCLITGIPSWSRSKKYIIYSLL